MMYRAGQIPGVRQPSSGVRNRKGALVDEGMALRACGPDVEEMCTERQICGEAATPQVVADYRIGQPRTLRGRAIPSCARYSAA